MPQTSAAAAARSLLRREKIAARMALTPQEHARASALVCNHLQDWLLPMPGALIAFCPPMRGEVDCNELVLRLLAAGWRAAMPAVTQKHKPMQFRLWTPQTPLAPDHLGLMAPTGPAATPDIVLAPLAAADRAGYRLGYGGGYFDRTLAALQPPPLCIGVGFDLCLVDSVFPHQFDVKLDFLVTESGLRRT